VNNFKSSDTKSPGDSSRSSYSRRMARTTFANFRHSCAENLVTTSERGAPLASYYRLVTVPPVRSSLVPKVVLSAARPGG
jgi:hypothetical protein